MNTAGVEVLLYCTLLGVGLGVLFAALETIRLVLGLGKIVTALLDVLFCAVAACASFLLALAIYAGRIRFFQFGGEVLGFLLVQWTWTYGIKRVLPRLLSGLSGYWKRMCFHADTIWEKQRCRRRKDPQKLLKKRIISDSSEKKKKRLE